MKKENKMKLIITGPRSVGKTTISKIVAEKLGLQYISSDEIGEKVFEKYGGLDKAIKSGIVEKIINKGGYNLILNVLEKEDNFVFDLSGGSISSRRMAKASEKIRKSVKENSDFITGLLPSKNKPESVKFLFEREKNREHFKNKDQEELFSKIEKDYNKILPVLNELCNRIIYIKDEGPNKIANEIIKQKRK